MPRRRGVEVEPAEQRVRWLERGSRWITRAPHSIVLGATLLVLLGVVFGSGLGNPLVFGDFVVLSPERLKAHGEGGLSFEPGGLARASFGWTWRLAGLEWTSHRAVALALHAAGSIGLFLLLRRLFRTSTAAADGRALPVAWLAFFAALLYAVHPVSVYGVAYLAQRPALIAGVGGILAMLAFVRGVQERSYGSLAAVPVAFACALLGATAVITLPLVLGALLWQLRPAHARERWAALGSIAASAVVAALFVAQAPADVVTGTEPSTTGAAPWLDHLAMASGRLLRYLGYWIVPWTPWMAIDLPEPAARGMAAASGWGYLSAIVLLGAVAFALVARRARAGLAGIAMLSFLLLGLPELSSPRWSAPLELGRSYPWTALLYAFLPLVAARVDARAAWLTLAGIGLLFTALAVERAGTFSTHVRLWDDAIARAQRVGAGPEAARLYLNRAALHRRDGHVFVALADYDKVLALVPDHRRALRGRAQAHLDARQYDAALRDLDRLIELEPRQGSLVADRAVVLLESGKALEALQELDRAIALGVADARTYLNRGLARMRLGGLSAAKLVLEDIDRAAAINPDYALAHFNRGAVFEESANAGTALRDAPSPEIMRMIAQRNYAKACELGHRPGCAAAARLGKPGGGAEPVPAVAPQPARPATR